MLVICIDEKGKFWIKEAMVFIYPSEKYGIIPKIVDRLCPRLSIIKEKNHPNIARGTTGATNILASIP